MRTGLYVVSGPGGVGKGTVVATVARRHPEIVVSVSATTRAPRPGEVDGVHYRFLDDDAFDALVAADGFLEWASFAGHRYGTPWAGVRTALSEGHPVVLEIDVQGAAQVRQRFPGAVLIFLQPPSAKALAERLSTRGADDPERIAERLRLGQQEMVRAGDFDHRVVNDDLDGAVGAITRILGG
ncbi:MAG: guanylate kinase [Actinomycetota bacterium]|jgi:guanylate kinase|nr:guanylate kinase [Euzebyaceae bacterium]MDQ3453599.1 guanylate kinase [Actinomycetota bacterium]